MVFLTQSEVKRLLKCIDNPRDKAIFLLAYRHGLRASEVGILRRFDLCLDRGRILIPRLKNGIPGEHPLSSDEVAVLKKYLKTRKDSSEVLFRNKRGCGIKRYQLHRLMKKYCQMAGIPKQKARFHALRHSAGVHRCDAGMDILLVKDWLGHKNIQNTIIYTHVASERRDLEYVRVLRTGKVV